MALQPINYFQQITGGQSPLQSAIGTTQGLQGLQANQAAIEAQRQQTAARQQQMELGAEARELLAQYQADPTNYDALEQAVLIDPALSKSVIEATGIRSQAQAGQAAEFILSANEAVKAGNIPEATRIAQARIQQLQAEGRDPTQTQNFLNTLQSGDLDMAGADLRVAGAAMFGQGMLNKDQFGILQGQTPTQLPAAIQELEYFQNLSPEAKEEVLAYKGRGGPDLTTKLDIERANDILKNPERYAEGVVQWAQGITGSAQPIAESLYGGLSSDKANAYLNDAELAQSSWNQLSRQLNLLEDMKDAGLSLKGSGAANFLRSWVGEIAGLDSAERNELIAAIDTGTLDIARQLSQALRPVSEKQLQIVIDSLKGGNVDAAIQSVRSTANQAKNDFDRNRRLLTRNKAGIADELPESLEFVRTPGVIQRENVQFGPGQQPAQPAQPAQPRAPAVGTVQDGWRFLGGDPGDQRNWAREGR